MQCPICKKDLEIKNKKIGENEAGEAIYNEFAICRDCKKQWNLDKQREKKKKLAKEALAEKTVEAGKAAEKPHKKRPAAEGEKTSAERPAQPKKKKKRPVSPENAEKRTASSANPEVPAHPKKKHPNPAAEGERPVRKPRPKTEGSSEEQPSRPHPNALLLQTVHFSNMQKVRKKAGKKFVHVRKRNVRKKPNRYMQLTIPAHVSFLMKRMNLKLLHLIFPLQREKKNRPILISHQSMSVKNVNRRCVRTIRIC